MKEYDAALHRADGLPTTKIAKYKELAVLLQVEAGAFDADAGEFKSFSVKPELLGTYGDGQFATVDAEIALPRFACTAATGQNLRTASTNRNLYCVVRLQDVTVKIAAVEIVNKPGTPKIAEGLGDALQGVVDSLPVGGRMEYRVSITNASSATYVDFRDDKGQVLAR